MAEGFKDRILGKKIVCLGNEQSISFTYFKEDDTSQAFAMTLTGNNLQVNFCTSSSDLIKDCKHQFNIYIPKDKDLGSSYFTLNHPPDFYLKRNTPNQTNTEEVKLQKSNGQNFNSLSKDKKSAKSSVSKSHDGFVKTEGVGVIKTLRHSMIIYQKYTFRLSKLKNGFRYYYCKKCKNISIKYDVKAEEYYVKGNSHNHGYDLNNVFAHLLRYNILIDFLKNPTESKQIIYCRNVSRLYEEYPEASNWTKSVLEFKQIEFIFYAKALHRKMAKRLGLLLPEHPKDIKLVHPTHHSPSSIEKINGTKLEILSTT